MNKQTSNLNDAALDAVSGGAFRGGEVSMIALQSIVSNRGVALQLMSNMLRSMNDATKTIAGNIGR